jgi:hypothetical protein
LEPTIISFICDFPLRILLLFLAFNMEQYNTTIHGENRSTGSAKFQNHINMQRWEDALLTEDFVLHRCGQWHWLAADRIKMKTVERRESLERRKVFRDVILYQLVNDSHYSKILTFLYSTSIHHTPNSKSSEPNGSPTGYILANIPTTNKQSQVPDHHSTLPHLQKLTPLLWLVIH